MGFIISNEVFQALQGAESLINVSSSAVKGKKITFVRIPPDRKGETTNTSEVGDDIYSISTLWEKETGGMLRISLSALLNMDMEIGTGAAKATKKVYQVLTERNKENEGVNLDSSLEFTVVNVVDATDANGKKRYPMASYKTFGEAETKAKEAAVKNDVEYDRSELYKNESLRAECRGDDSKLLIDNAKQLKTLILK